MYECRICGEQFDEPESYSYVEDMDGEQHYERFFVNCCPLCGSEEIEESK